MSVSAARRGPSPFVLLPLVVFVALAGVFGLRMMEGGETNVVPSPLIGRPAPDATFPPLLPTLPGIDPAAFKGRVTLVNIFASWCAPCRVEHPRIMALAETPGLAVVGIDYKDAPDKGRAFLAELGNPFDAVGVDPDGRGAIDWGLTGVPESFLVGPDGTIRYKHTGPIDEDALAGPLGAALKSLLPAS